MAASGHYFRLLDRVHRHVLPRTYLEIGVFKGKSMALTLPGTAAVGVDPAAQLLYPQDPSARTYAMTSDDFFASTSRAEVFGELPVDLAFVDGMHLAENVLRDVRNVETWCAPGSVVLLHDVYPPDADAAERDWTGRYWAGDVFKALLVLRDLRPDLRVDVVDVPPTGLGVVTGLDPGNRVLFDRYEEALERCAAITWEEVADRKDELFGAVPDDWDRVRALLPASPFRSPVPRQRLHRALRRPKASVLPSEIERRVGLTPLGPALRGVKRIVADRRGRHLGDADISAPQSPGATGT